MKSKTWTTIVLATLVAAIGAVTLYVVTLTPRSAQSSSKIVSIWPLPASHRTFTDVTTAALSVATDFGHMANVVIDNSGRVSGDTWVVLLQSGATGPRTSVYLTERASDQSWWVTSVSAQDIVLGYPKWQSAVSNPFHVTGLSTAFEATVNGTVSSRTSGQMLKRFTAMGGANGIVGAFSATIAVPSSSTGVKSTSATIMLYEVSAKDGSVMEFSAAPLTINATH